MKKSPRFEIADSFSFGQFVTLQIFQRIRRRHARQCEEPDRQRNRRARDEKPAVALEIAFGIEAQARDGKQRRQKRDEEKKRESEPHFTDLLRQSLEPAQRFFAANRGLLARDIRDQRLADVAIHSHAVARAAN